MDPFELTALSRTECGWVAPWLISRLCQTGYRHYALQQETQDAHAVGTYGATFWMIVADGVGSCPLSHYGSRTAVAAAHAYLGAAVTSGRALSEALVVDAVAAARDAVVALSQRTNATLVDYSSTLALAVINGNTIVAGSLGDSSIVACAHHDDGTGTKRPAFEPFCTAPQVLTSNTTAALTRPDWKDCLVTRESQSPHINALIVATDGAVPFFVDVDDAAQPFDTRSIQNAEPFLRQLTPRKFSNFMAEHLANVEEDNQDDRTLLLAWRPPRSLAPPTAQP